MKKLLIVRAHLLISVSKNKSKGEIKMCNNSKTLLLRNGIIAFIFSSLSACATFNNVLLVEEVDEKLKTLSYSDDLQNTFVKKGKNGTKICSQPDPDAAQAFADGLTVGVGTQGEGVQDSSNATSLGGRNPAVLIAREILYRACELTMNYDADYDQARSIYTEFLGVLSDLGKTQTGVGSASVAGNVTNIQTKGSSDSDDGDDDYDLNKNSNNDSK